MSNKEVKLTESSIKKMKREDMINLLRERGLLFSDDVATENHVSEPVKEAQQADVQNDDAVEDEDDAIEAVPDDEETAEFSAEKIVENAIVKLQSDENLSKSLVTYGKSIANSVALFVEKNPKTTGAIVGVTAAALGSVAVNSGLASSLLSGAMSIPKSIAGKVTGETKALPSSMSSAMDVDSGMEFSLNDIKVTKINGLSIADSFTIEDVDELQELLYDSVVALKERQGENWDIHPFNETCPSTPAGHVKTRVYRKMKFSDGSIRKFLMGWRFKRKQ